MYTISLIGDPFAAIIPSSWHCPQPSMDGVPEASTILNLALIDSSLKKMFSMAALMFPILEPP